MPSAQNICPECGKDYVQKRNLDRHIIFDDMRAGKKTLLKCIKDHAELYDKYDKLLTIQTKIDTPLCIAEEKTGQQREETALRVEEFGKFFPVNFNRNMPRKMSLLSIEAPKQVREDGDFFKYLKLEQEIERAHNVLNKLERQFECVKNKVENFI